MRRITFARLRIRRSARPSDRVLRSRVRRCRSWPSSAPLCGFADRVKNCMRVRRRSCQDNRSRRDSHAGCADHTGSFQFSVFRRPCSDRSSGKHAVRCQRSLIMKVFHLQPAFSPPGGRSTPYDRQDFVALACRAQRTVQVRLRAPSGSRLVLAVLSRTSPRHVVRNAG